MYSDKTTSPREIILVKAGELALKGLNKSTFEDMLIKNLRRSLSGAGEFRFRKAQSTIYIEPEGNGANIEEAARRVSKVFGIAAYSIARVAEKKMDDILRAAAEFMGEELLSARTFKVVAKRSDKSFELKSPEICDIAGRYLLGRFPHLKVDVHDPEALVVIEIRDFGAYIHSRQHTGAGGMPVGSGGKAALLISGGIDSPVAGYMMAKRGLSLTGIHFVSPPYTSERAELKVISLMEKLSQYAGEMDLLLVPFTRIQLEISRCCPESLSTVIMRRFMMRISTLLAEKLGCGALITGESVGQVASQTLQAVACTDAAAGLPVLRPLVGMDKDEIVEIARRIETYEISIQPYQDCCTVFTPKHPRTKPRLETVVEAESALEVDRLVNEATEGARKIRV